MAIRRNTCWLLRTRRYTRLSIGAAGAVPGSRRTGGTTQPRRRSCGASRTRSAWPRWTSSTPGWRNYSTGSRPRYIAATTPGLPWARCVRYAAFHFGCEERLMARIGYAGAAGHCDMHQRLLADISGLALEGEGVSTSLILQLPAGVAVPPRGRTGSRAGSGTALGSASALSRSFCGDGSAWTVCGDKRRGSRTGLACARWGLAQRRVGCDLADVARYLCDIDGWFVRHARSQAFSTKTSSVEEGRGAA